MPAYVPVPACLRPYRVHHVGCNLYSSKNLKRAFGDDSPLVTNVHFHEADVSAAGGLPHEVRLE